MPEVFAFRPRDDEVEWINKNIDNWSNFCHDMIYYHQRNDFYERLNRFSNRIFVVLFGAILMSLSYVFPISTIWIIWITTGIVMIGLGFLMLGLEVRNERRCRY